MKREAMIERLIKDDIQVIKDALLNKDYEYLDFILRDGVGYNKMSDESIVEEFRTRSWEATE